MEGVTVVANAQILVSYKSTQNVARNDAYLTSGLRPLTVNHWPVKVKALRSSLYTCCNLTCKEHKKPMTLCINLHTGNKLQVNAKSKSIHSQ